MQLLRNFLFMGSLSLYLANRYLLAGLDLAPYKIPYLNDLLCLPIVLSLALWIQQKLFPMTCRPVLNAAQVIFAVLYFALFFEVVLPAFSRRYTRDYLDILAYAVGGIIYYFFFNPQPKPLPRPE